MQKKFAFKLVIDIIMTILLMCSFAYQLTGNLAHEIIGTITLLLFATHTLINQHWFKYLHKGTYKLHRILNIFVNCLILILIIFLAITSVTISHDLFSFEKANSFTLRQLHTSTAFWLLIFIGVHIGLQWSKVLSVLQKIPAVFPLQTFTTSILRICSLSIFFFGVYSFSELDISNKLFMQYTFSYWDFEKATAKFFLMYLSVLGLYAITTYYLLIFITNFFPKRNNI